MDNPKTLSAALCRIYDEVGAEVLKDPDKLLAIFLDIAPNLKTERNQLEILIKSSYLKKLAVSAGEDKSLVDSAVDTLCGSYSMDRGKAEELCRAYVDALYGKEYHGTAAKEPAAVSFELTVEDVFTIAGRGIVVTGYVVGAAVRTGDAITIVKKNGGRIPATVGGIENSKKLLNSAAPGLAVGILLPGLSRKDVERDDVLVTGDCPAAGKRDVGGFHLTIESSFDVRARGVVVTGWVRGDSVRVGDKVSLIKKSGQALPASVAGIERYRTLLDRAEPGDAVGLLLPELKSKQIETGDKLVKR